MSKDIWCEVWNRLKEELQRFPTDKEMDEAYSRELANLTDAAERIMEDRESDAIYDSYIDSDMPPGAA